MGSETAALPNHVLMNRLRIARNLYRDSLGVMYRLLLCFAILASRVVLFLPSGREARGNAPPTLIRDSLQVHGTIVRDVVIAFLLVLSA